MKGSLWSQPGSFWLGAFFVAEGISVFALSLLPPDQRAIIANFAFFTPLGVIVTVLASVVLGLCVGWIGHRLGLGE